MTNAQRAEVLTQALPYIQKYTNKIVVVKYGGNAMINDELKDAVMGDIVLLSLIGIKVVLVHGGGPEITQMLKQIGKETRFVNGLRVSAIDGILYKARAGLIKRAEIPMGHTASANVYLPFITHSSLLIDQKDLGIWKGLSDGYRLIDFKLP